MSEPNVHEQLAGMTIERDAAQTALRDMEIERNMLRHALEGVLAKAEGRKQ